MRFAQSKRRGLVRLTLLFIAIALAYLSVSSNQAANPGECEPHPPSTAELVKQINGPGPQEWIPEIRAAISWGLTLRYLGEKDDAGNPVWTINELRAIAGDGNNSLELREAAGQALSERLKEIDLSLKELMEIAISGKTSQVRAAADGALVAGIYRALKKGNKSIAEVISWVTTGETDELRLLAARAVFEYLKCKLVGRDGQALVEDIVSGKPVEVFNLTIGGSIVYFREVAVDFLASLYIYFFGRFKNPIEELSEIATNLDLTPEFRTAASKALAYYFEGSKLTKDDLEELALNGETKELRWAAAAALGKRLAQDYRAGRITITDLYKLGVRGTTMELGMAAIPGLAFYLSGGLLDGWQLLEERFYLERFYFGECGGEGRGVVAGNFHDPHGNWLHRLGYYHWGDYLCVQLDGPWWADWDLYVWRERYHTSRTLYIAGPVCSSTSPDADEYCCTCIWTSGYYWSEVRYLHGSGTAHLRWGVNRGGCR